MGECLLRGSLVWIQWVWGLVVLVGWALAPLVKGIEGLRPEEPAKYINELPKLTQVELSQSAVVCGN